MGRVTATIDRFTLTRSKHVAGPRGVTSFLAVAAKERLARLEGHDVGGVAAVLQGVPLTTIDLDIVHRRTPENVARLLQERDKGKQ